MTTLHEPEDGPKRKRIPHSITIITTANTGRVLAFLAVTVAFVAGLLFVTHLNAKTNDLAVHNAKLLAEFEAFRHARSEQTTQTDIKLCRAINTITRRDRATFLQGQKGNEKILRLLGLSPAQLRAVRKATRQSNARELRRRPLVNCGNLPTSRLGSAPKKLP